MSQILEQRYCQVTEGVRLEFPDSFGSPVEPRNDIVEFDRELGVNSLAEPQSNIVQSDRQSKAVVVGGAAVAVAIGSAAYVLQPAPAYAALTVAEVVTSFTAIATGVDTVATALFAPVVGVLGFSIIGGLAMRFVR